MLSQFGSYNLPLVKSDSYRFAGNLSDTSQESQFMDGWNDGAGQNPQPQAGALITVTFVIHPEYLDAHGYGGTNDYGRLETAIIDFAGNVIDGGTQTLTDALPSDTSVNGNFATHRTVRAKVVDSYESDREEGVKAEITVTFRTKRPKWKYNDSAQSEVRIL
jgi:hypothetical protein